MQALAVWGRAHYLSVTEEALKVSGEDLVSLIFQAGSFNHYTWAPAPVWHILLQKKQEIETCNLVTKDALAVSYFIPYNNDLIG